MRGLDFAEYEYEKIAIISKKSWFRHFIIIKFNEDNRYNICLNTNQMKDLKKALNEDFKK